MTIWFREMTIEALNQRGNNTITHLGYGKYLSLKSYLLKRKIHDVEINQFDGLKNEK